MCFNEDMQQFVHHLMQQLRTRRMGLELPAQLGNGGAAWLQTSTESREEALSCFCTAGNHWPGVSAPPLAFCSQSASIQLRLVQEAVTAHCPEGDGGEDGVFFVLFFVLQSHVWLGHIRCVCLVSTLPPIGSLIWLRFFYFLFFTFIYFKFYLFYFMDIFYELLPIQFQMSH